MVSNEEIKNAKLFDVEDIMDIIQDQFQNIMGWDPDFYGDYDIVLKNEQMYVSDKDRTNPNKIYIIVKFLPAEINLKQNLIPLTITAVSERNKINVCQRILMEYAQVFNLRPSSYLDGSKKVSYNQTYEAPTTMSNFNDIFDGYRSLFVISGEFLISTSMNPADLYYYPDGEGGEGILIETLAYMDSFEAVLDTQPYTNTKNFTESVVQYATNSFSFTTYLVSNELCNKLLKIRHKKLDLNTGFVFGVKYLNQQELNDGEPFIDIYKFQSMSTSKEIGSFPILTVSFIN